MHKIQFQTISKSPNIQRCSPRQISPDPVLTNIEINLFVQGNLLFFIEPSSELPIVASKC